MRWPQAEHFALTEYLSTLAGPPLQGDAAKNFYARVAQMTGLSVDVIAQARGFIPDDYVKNLHVGDHKIVSHYDATFASDDPYPESPTARGPDPILDGVVRAYGGAFVAYARDELGFKTDMTYTLLASDISGKWHWREGSSRGQPSVADDLRVLLALTPSFHLMIAHGYSDMVTPYAVTPLRARPSAAGRRRGAHPAQALSRRPHVLSRPGLPQGLHRRRAHHVRAAMTDVAHRTANDGLDQFIPVRKSDILSALVEQGDCKSDEEREKFRRLCDMLAAIYHYDYFQTLERLRNDYYYFSPEVAPHAALDRASRERCYADLVQSLEQVLKDANFIELPHAEIGDAHRRRAGQRVEVKAPLHDFRDVRFWRRGRHTEQFEVADWFGLRRRTGRSRSLRRRRPHGGDEIARRDRLAAGTENAGSPQDRSRLGAAQIFPQYRQRRSQCAVSQCARGDEQSGQADAGLAGDRRRHPDSAQNLCNHYGPVPGDRVLSGYEAPSVEDKDIATALAALGGILALGGFVVQQWVKYQWKSLRYQSELTDNVYYRNINNNAGIFDYLIGAAEDQECKEAFLAYHFLHTAAAPPTADELDGRIEAWLRQTFGVEIDFAVNGALGKLEGLGPAAAPARAALCLTARRGARPIASRMGRFLAFRAESTGEITKSA